MSRRRRPARPSVADGLRVLLAGTVALGAVGSCELPKPPIPKLGAAPRPERVAIRPEVTAHGPERSDGPGSAANWLERAATAPRIVATGPGSAANRAAHGS